MATYHTMSSKLLAPDPLVCGYNAAVDDVWNLNFQNYPFILARQISYR